MSKEIPKESFFEHIYIAFYTAPSFVDENNNKGKIVTFSNGKV